QHVQFPWLLLFPTSPTWCEPSTPACDQWSSLPPWQQEQHLRLRLEGRQLHEFTSCLPSDPKVL
ncbi:hypothetical protein BGZ82_002927, partial [Podila clonocystis]